MDFYLNPIYFYKNIDKKSYKGIVFIQIFFILIFSVISSNAIKSELMIKFKENGIQFNNTFFIGIFLFITTLMVMLLIISIWINSFILKILGIILNGQNTNDSKIELLVMSYINFIYIIPIILYSIIGFLTKSTVEINLYIKIIIYLIISIYIFLFFKYMKKLSLPKSAIGTFSFILIYLLIDFIRIFI
uniref:Yip1 domain-containing protein n=6 Tax=Clostridium perfringens TaxID=1502 RepID=A0A4Y5T5H9_CLOPF|nr:hypothetical protein [Clostridium perfringens]